MFLSLVLWVHFDARFCIGERTTKRIMVLSDVNRPNVAGLLALWVSFLYQLIRFHAYSQSLLFTTSTSGQQNWVTFDFPRLKRSRFMPPAASKP
jgi:hypothetical protein